MAVLQRHKSTIYGLVTDLTALTNADGILANLTTTEKTNLVGAINEVDASVGTLETQNGVAVLTTTSQTLSGAINEVDAQIGNAVLTTTSQTLSGAVNEIDAQIGNDVLTTTATTLSGAINEIDSKKLAKASNLSDLADKPTARTNLDVYSKSEVTTAINNASLSLGTNFAAADAAAAGTTFTAGILSIGDNIFLTDDGDTKWAIYQVTAVTDGAYGTSTLEKIMDEDVYLNAQSAAAIKSAYESNLNTNAFTDAAETKVGFISVTGAIDLDKVIQSDELYVDGTFVAATSNTTIASSLAVKTYVDTKNALDLKIASNLSDLADKPTARTNLDVFSKAEVTTLVGSGGAVFITETLTVTADKITLTYAPKNGVIFNFATVRHTDANFVSYDIPVTITATAGNKEFLLHGNSAGEFDTKSVTVQYSYTA